MIEINTLDKTTKVELLTLIEIIKMIKRNGADLESNKNK